MTRLVQWAMMIVLSVTIATSGYAQTALVVELPVVEVPDKVVSVQGQPIELVGLSTGLSPDATAKRLLEQGYRSIDVQFYRPDARTFDYEGKQIELRGKTDVIYSQRFAKDFPEYSDLIVVRYSSAYNGNKSLSINRSIEYREGVPYSEDAIRKSLVDKFGPPSTDKDCWYWSTTGKLNTAGCGFGAADQALEFEFRKRTARIDLSNPREQSKAGIKDQHVKKVTDIEIQRKLREIKSGAGAVVPKL